MTGKNGKRVRRSFVLMVAAFVISLAAYGYLIDRTDNLARQGKDNAVQGKQAHDAICTLKADYRERIRAGLAFLHKHPDGIPGVDAAVIRDSIDNQQKTLAALAAVLCTSPG